MSAAVPDREPGDRIGAFDTAMRRVRLVVVAVVAGSVYAARADDSPFAYATAIGVAAMLIAANALSHVADRSDGRQARVMIGGQLGLDLVAAATVVVAHGGLSGSIRWAVLVLPVIHAAVRYQLTGAAAAWGAVLAILLGRAIWAWQPTAGIEQLSGLVGPLAVLLAVGLAVGYVVLQLVAEIELQREMQLDAHVRARLLATLTLATQRLLVVDPRRLPGLTTSACMALGFPAAELWTATNGGTGWLLAGAAPCELPKPVPVVTARDDVEVVTVPIPGHQAMLCVGLSEGDRFRTVRLEALEFLAQEVASALGSAYRATQAARPGVRSSALGPQPSQGA